MLSVSGGFLPYSELESRIDLILYDIISNLKASAASLITASIRMSAKTPYLFQEQGTNLWNI